jgi:hypothetical protein
MRNSKAARKFTPDGGEPIDLGEIKEVRLNCPDTKDQPQIETGGVIRFECTSTITKPNTFRSIFLAQLERQKRNLLRAFKKAGLR